MEKYKKIILCICMIFCICFLGQELCFGFTQDDKGGLEIQKEFVSGEDKEFKVGKLPEESEIWNFTNPYGSVYVPVRRMTINELPEFLFKSGLGIVVIFQLGLIIVLFVIIKVYYGEKKAIREKVFDCSSETKGKVTYIEKKDVYHDVYTRYGKRTVYDYTYYKTEFEYYVDGVKLKGEPIVKYYERVPMDGDITILYNPAYIGQFVTDWGMNNTIEKDWTSWKVKRLWIGFMICILILVAFFVWTYFGVYVIDNANCYIR
ncbi:MAG: hypothetical protein K6G26_00655 [Lachnospiraceae bacterium]|nr:hypothetical protein [Lachnospiraceae bacterium]